MLPVRFFLTVFCQKYIVQDFKEGKDIQFITAMDQNLLNFAIMHFPLNC